MKQLLTIATIATILTSCEKPPFMDDDTQQYQMQFCIVTPSVSRAQSAADFRTLVITDLQNGTVQQTIRKEYTDADFSAPTITLSQGSHTLRFLATDANNTQQQGTVLTWNPVGDTFLRSVDITAHDGKETVILNRITAKVVNEQDQSVSVSGIANSIDLATLKTSGNIQTTLVKGASVYSLIPASGIITANGKAVAVKANTVTAITTNGTAQELLPGGQEENEDEYLALTTDTALIYVAKKEIPDIILADNPNIPDLIANALPYSITDGSQILAKAASVPVLNTLYRVPTRLEASQLRKVTLPAGYWQSQQRALCYDDPRHAGIKVNSTDYGTGYWYTFTWGSGSVSKAGEKTKYTITPVRSQPLAPLSVKLSYSADFTWSTDTIK